MLGRACLLALLLLPQVALAEEVPPPAQSVLVVPAPVTTYSYKAYGTLEAVEFVAYRLVMNGKVVKSGLLPAPGGEAFPSNFSEGTLEILIKVPDTTTPGWRTEIQSQKKSAGEIEPRTLKPIEPHIWLLQLPLHPDDDTAYWQTERGEVYHYKVGQEDSPSSVTDTRFRAALHFDQKNLGGAVSLLRYRASSIEYHKRHHPPSPPPVPSRKLMRQFLR